SDPQNPFLEARAEQLGEDPIEYRKSLSDLLSAVASAFQNESSCKLYVYNGLPIQLWHRIDDVLYLNVPSLRRRSRNNCMFGVPISLEGASETFLEHFDALKALAHPYPATSGKYATKRSKKQES